MKNYSVIDMKSYSVVVTATKEEDAESGKMKSYIQCYFENAIDAVKFYQQLESQPEVVHTNIYAASGEL